MKLKTYGDWTCGKVRGRGPVCIEMEVLGREIKKENLRPILRGSLKYYGLIFLLCFEQCQLCGGWAPKGRLKAARGRRRNEGIFCPSCRKVAAEWLKGKKED